MLKLPGLIDPHVHVREPGQTHKEDWDTDLPLLIHPSVHPYDHWSQCADILRIVEARAAIRFVLAHSCRFHLLLP